MFFPVDSDLSRPYLYGVDLTEGEPIEKGTLPYWMEERLDKDPGTWYHLPPGILTRNRQSDLCFPAAMGMHGECVTLLQDRMMETMYSGGWQREVETTPNSARMRVKQSVCQKAEQRDTWVELRSEWIAGVWQVKYGFYETTVRDLLTLERAQAIRGIISATRRLTRVKNLNAPEPIIEGERELIEKRFLQISHLYGGVRLPKELDKLRETLGELGWTEEDLAALWDEQRVPQHLYNTSKWGVATVKGKRPRKWTRGLHDSCSQLSPTHEELNSWHTACETIVDQTRALCAIVFEHREELAKRGQLWDPLFLLH